MVAYLPPLSCESSVSVKGNRDKKPTNLAGWDPSYEILDVPGDCGFYSYISLFAGIFKYLFLYVWIIDYV